MFRGKALKTSEWVFGFVQKKQVIGGVNWLIHEDLKASNAYYAPIVIDPSTLGQYTDQTDRNGVKIFEGDIIRFYDETDDHQDGEIFWNESECCFNVRWENDNVTEFGTFEAQCSEVIGNVYDTPELLEV